MFHTFPAECINTVKLKNEWIRKTDILLAFDLRVFSSFTVGLSVTGCVGIAQALCDDDLWVCVVLFGGPAPQFLASHSEALVQEAGAVSWLCPHCGSGRAGGSCRRSTNCSHTHAHAHTTDHLEQCGRRRRCQGVTACWGRAFCAAVAVVGARYGAESRGPGAWELGGGRGGGPGRAPVCLHRTQRQRTRVCTVLCTQSVSAQHWVPR